jgi:cytochrome b pre-mRNA-processing protein 3
MSLLSRLTGPRRDPHAEVRAGWQRIIAIAREPDWYRDGGVADSVAGRFDAITLVLALVLLRLERDPAAAGASARLTELFVTDMDGQLRQSGVGDLVVGKHVGKLMSALGGRIGALRAALGSADDAALEAVVARNVTLVEGADPARVAVMLRALARALDQTSVAGLLSGDIAR